LTPGAACQARAGRRIFSHEHAHETARPSRDLDAAERDFVVQTGAALAEVGIVRLAAKHPDGKEFAVKDYVDAMERLLNAGKLRIEEAGPPSRRRQRIVGTAGGNNGD
jgi:hypothetical protein